MKITSWLARGTLVAAILSVFLPAVPARAQTLDIPEAIENTQAMLQSQPADAPLRMRLVKLYFVQGASQLKGNDPAGAAKSFTAALRTAAEGQGSISGSEEVIVLANYALAYASKDQGLTQEAVAVLKELVQTAPDFWMGRYMLGSLLMGSESEDDYNRGAEGMRKLHADSTAEQQARVAQAAAQLAYERSLRQYKAGQAQAALATLQEMLGAYGANPSPVTRENLAIHFAVGRYQEAVGNAQGALKEYEAILQQDSAFEVSQGVTIRDVVANAQYHAGVEALVRGGEAGAHEALEHFDRAQSLQRTDTVDLHHGKLRAYRVLGDKQAAAAELHKIRDLDPGYYESVKKGKS